MSYYTYIMASKRNGALYIGSTDNLKERASEHKRGQGCEYTKHYKINRLVYFEVFHSAQAAALREKRLKKWNRDWKIRLIEENNPAWDDLWAIPLCQGFGGTRSPSYVLLEGRRRGRAGTGQGI